MNFILIHLIHPFKTIWPFDLTKVGLLILLLSSQTLIVRADDVPVAQKGILDASAANLAEDRLPLNGDWQYYPHQLLTPAEITNTSEVVTMPHLWDSGNGYNTYALLVICPKGQRTYSLQIPQVYSAYNLWINGKLLASNGKPGKSKEETIPQWLPKAISFEVTNDSIRLVLQLANFNHFKGGIKEPIYLGSDELLYDNQRTSEVSTLAEAVTLMLIGIIFLLTHLVQDRKKIVFYFAMLCITWSVRSIFSNLYLFISYVPDFNWEAMVKIEYITLYMTMVWAILFLGRLFEKETNTIIKYLLVTVNCSFAVFTLLTPAIIFTRWLNVYLFFSVVLLVYGSFLVLRALAHERTGSGFLSVSISLGLLIYAYDVLAYKGIFSYNAIIFSSGYILLFITMGFGLLVHLNIIKSKKENTAMLRYEDLFKDN